MLDRLQLLERRDIDELIILDIAATPRNAGPRFTEARELSQNVFCPITIGGGVTRTSDFQRLLANGADKVCVCTGALEVPELIGLASHRFGAQAVVVGIDVRQGTAWLHAGRRDTGRDAVEWASECEDRGAGEILLTDIERDGTMQGYNLELIHAVASAIGIPVIACGGCGSVEHMKSAVDAGAHAVAAGAMFQFREVTPKDGARYLDAHGIAARV